MSAPAAFPNASTGIMSILGRIVAWASDVNRVLRTSFGRVAFRATVCYLALFTPVVFSSLGFLGLPLHWYENIWRVPASTIARMFVAPNTPHNVNDDHYQLALVCCFLIVAGVATVVWTALAKPDQNYIRAHDWVRIAMRYVLIYVSLHYAIVMFLRFELPAMTPEALVTRASELRPRELLWLFFGWLWYFPFFLGVLELASAVLLLNRRTTLLGGLLLGGLLSNVVLLNVVFDVPGKILSPHIALMTGLLILPHLDRIWRTHISRESVPPGDTTPDVPAGGWLRDHRVAIKTALVLLFATSSVLFVSRSRGYLIYPPHGPLAGVYKVVAPADSNAGTVSAPHQWQWAIVSPDGTRLHVQHRNELWSSYVIAIDGVDKRLLLGALRPSEWRERWDTRDWRDIHRVSMNALGDTLRYAKEKNRIQVVGALGGQPIQLSLQPVDLVKQFILVGPRRSFEVRDPARTRRDIAKKSDTTRRADSTTQKRK